MIKLLRWKSRKSSKKLKRSINRSKLRRVQLTPALILPPYGKLMNKSGISMRKISCFRKIISFLCSMNSKNLSLKYFQTQIRKLNFQFISEQSVMLIFHVSRLNSPLGKKHRSRKLLNVWLISEILGMPTSNIVLILDNP